jgi:ribonuclease HI
MPKTSQKIQNTQNAVIFTDGSSRGNPGPGGWGSVVILNRIVTELGGAKKNTTNNRMELEAALNGLKYLPKNHTSPITVYTDSSYLINGITKWIQTWQKNNWLTKTKDPVLNKDIWEKLIEQIAGRKITWEYIGGHIGIVGNERCDHIATAFADGRKINLYKGPIGNYDLPNVLEIHVDSTKMVAKKSTKAHAKMPAYSYVSMVDGVIEVHKSWQECEKRVKGTKGARYKKAVDAFDEFGIIAEFEAI